MNFIRSTSIALFVLAAAPAFAQSGNKMTGDQLAELTANGVVLKLGGDGEGYSGTLELQPDGTAKGGATTDGGVKIQIVGTWAIRGDKFCRVWIVALVYSFRWDGVAKRATGTGNPNLRSA